VPEQRLGQSGAALGADHLARRPARCRAPAVGQGG
jgi:hypothetical protein